MNNSNEVITNSVDVFGHGPFRPTMSKEQTNSCLTNDEGVHFEDLVDTLGQEVIQNIRDHVEFHKTSVVLEVAESLPKTSKEDFIDLLNDMGKEEFISLFGNRRFESITD